MNGEDKNFVDENTNFVDDREEATIGMKEIDGFDFERAIQLMSVIEKCATVGVKATSIAGIAQASLNEMNEAAKTIAKNRAAELAKLEAAAALKVAMQKQEVEAKAKAQAEKDAEAANVKARAIPTNPELANPARTPIAASRTAQVADNNARRV
jgi:hypothetical protein